jgi:hypothetical protein
MVLSYQSEAGRLAHELEQWIKKMKCSGTTGLSLGKHNITLFSLVRHSSELSIRGWQAGAVDQENEMFQKNNYVLFTESFPDIRIGVDPSPVQPDSEASIHTFYTFFSVVESLKSSSKKMQHALLTLYIFTLIWSIVFAAV